MSQMLVIHISVLMAEEGQIKYLSDVLDEVRVHFMIHKIRSPFSWVLRLREYGKRSGIALQAWATSAGLTTTNGSHTNSLS